MAGRLAVDFGTSNTVVARWDPTRGEGVSLWLPELGRHLSGPDGQAVAVVPSLIHYAGERVWLGEQVRRHQLAEAAATFRWMKRYVARRSPVRRRVEGGEISPSEAGRDFLLGVLAAARLEVEEEEVALTVPVEAFEDYAAWLGGVARLGGLARFHL